MTKSMEVRVFQAADFVAGVAGAWEKILEVLTQNQTHRPALAISGGNTPGPVYREFRRLDPENLLISRCRWFQTDERNVESTHAQSNQAMMKNTLFGGMATPNRENHQATIFFPVSVIPENPEQTAEGYEQMLRQHVGVLLNGVTSPIAVFDLIILGLGEDGHVASLFPDEKFSADTGRNFLPFWIGKLNGWRFTLTWQVLMAAKRVIFWVSGKNKAPVLAQVLAGQGRHLPAGRLAQERHVEWWIDSEAKP